MAARKAATFVEVYHSGSEGRTLAPARALFAPVRVQRTAAESLALMAFQEARRDPGALGRTQKIRFSYINKAGTVC